MDKQQLKEREARVIELAIFAKSTLMKCVQSYVQNLCRSWDVSVLAHYSLEGLRFGQLRQYIPSAASTLCSAKVLD